MTSPASKPMLGAALLSKNLAQHRNWLIEGQRDLEIQDFYYAETLDGDWKPLAQSIRQQLDGYHGRLGIHGPFWGFKIDSADAMIRKVVTHRFLQGLEVCEALGATQMVIHSPYTAWDYNNLDNNPGSRATITERVHLTLKDVVKRAETIGCELVIENIEDKDPAIRVDLVKTFNSNAVRVSIDTGHAELAHSLNDAPPVDYYVSAAANLLTHVHLQDLDGYADRHWLPGEGQVNFIAIFRALSHLTSKPRLIIEVRDQDGLRRGAGHLEALGLAQ